MVSDRYSKAYREVLEIIKYFPVDEYNMIPKEKIDFYEKNQDNDYDFSINPEKDLSEQNVSKEASAIIVSIYRDYFATEEQKTDIEKTLKDNEAKFEQEKREKYSPDAVFKNQSISNDSDESVSKIEVQEINMVKSNENWITKIKHLIFKILNLKEE